MKKKKNTVIQAPVRHTEPKYESHDGVLSLATSEVFSSGHPGSLSLILLCHIT